MYSIKPLEWRFIRTKHESGVEKSYKASNIFVNFEIQKMINDGTWYINYTFKEYYDDGFLRGQSLKECKIICEKMWIEKLEECLIKED